jgi:Spy/CpxP family protein refolding chaperone
MNCLMLFRMNRRWGVLMGLSFLTLVGVSAPGHGQQTSAAHQSHATNAATASADQASLVQQLRDLQIKVGRLEVALAQNHQAAAIAPAHSSGAGGQGAGMIGEQEMMGMDSMQSGQGMASGGGMGMDGMGMDGMWTMGMEGMAMMGQMQGMGSMRMPSALPGFPGASHIYHIGATGFFLDHPQHITLTPEQQTRLNQLKEKALLDQSTYDRSIAEGEQQIWVQTSSDSPDVEKIEAKVREVEKLRGDKRMAFIRAVGEAAMVLTDEQRQALVGHAPHVDASSTQQ